MRITNNMIAQAQLNGLSVNMNALMKAQNQISSGHRIAKASDDPVSATQIMASATSLRSLDQYRTNVQRASSRIDLEDTVTQQIGDIVSRVKELGISVDTATATPQTRKLAGVEIDELFKQLVTLGNTKFGDEYLFGGQQSTTAPFVASGSGASLDYTTTAPTGARQVAINAGLSISIAPDGSELLINSGVLDSVKQMAHALDSTSPSYGQAGIAAALTSIDVAFDRVQTVAGDVGAKAAQLDVTSQNLDAYKANLTQFKSNLEDVDMESAVTELTSHQMAYQAAMLATSKVMSLSLTDYLR